MITAKVVKAFISKGRLIEPGSLIRIAPNQLTVLGEHVELVNLHQLVGETLAEVDRLGRPWPHDFFASLPERERHNLRDLQRQIDNAVLEGDAEQVTALLDKWRVSLLKHLN